MSQKKLGLRKKMGEILVEAGRISSQQLVNALAIQKDTGKRIGKILIELGYVDDTQIAETLSQQLSLPLLDCKKFNPAKRDLALVPKELAERDLIFPLYQTEPVLFVSMADPLNWQVIDDLGFRTGLKINVGVSAEGNISEAIAQHYGSSDITWDFLKEIPNYDTVEVVEQKIDQDAEHVNFHSLFKDSSAPPIVKLVSMIISDAVHLGASDIHIEPMRQHMQVRYRIDGDLRNVFNFPSKIQESVISRIKIISNMDITNRRYPQDGRSTIRLKNKTIDLRVSTLPSIYGEKIVIRLLDSSSGVVPIRNIGLSEETMLSLIKIFNRPQGMIIITGPTGSGKTTTLYSILQQLCSMSKNIISIEDPVEYKMDGMIQVGINEEIGFTFAKALRSVLRQDPDIIMVGEIRDGETAEIAVRAAVTGHLVLTTLHTNDTVSSISRLLDIGLEPFMVSSAVSGILAQRLVRRICGSCKTQTGFPPDAPDINVSHEKTYFKGFGCSSCGNTGYKGRTAVFEFLTMDTGMRSLVSKGYDQEAMWKHAKEGGTTTLFEDAWSKVERGITTFEEIFTKVPYGDEQTKVSRRENRSKKDSHLKDKRVKAGAKSK